MLAAEIRPVPDYGYPLAFHLIDTSAGIQTRDVLASSKTKNLFKILHGAYAWNK